MRRLRIPLGLGLLAACGASTLPALDPAVPRLAAVRPENAASAAFSEQILCIATLEGEGSLYARFLVSNVAGASGRAQLRVRVSLGSQTAWFEARQNRGRWTAAPEGLAVDLGTAGLEVDEESARYWMRDAEGAEAEIRLSALAPGFRPSGGSADFGQGKRYETLVLFPAARLEGSFRPAGGEPVALRGLAYLEQRVSTILPFQAAERWYTVRRVDLDRVIVLSAWERPQHLGGQTQAWLLVAGLDGIEQVAPVLSLAPADPEVDETSGRSVPKTLAFSDPVAGVEGVVKAERLLERTDDLASLSKLERLVVERLMKPLTFRYEARYLLRHGDERVEGRAEYLYQSFR